MQSRLTFALLLSTVLQSAWCLRKYADELPNGLIAPNPCGGTWVELGHYTSGGGQSTGNGFGWAFAATGKNWKTVCSMDYDRDGKTNGEELGDPECKWTKGAEPAQKPSGNPVVCEPVNSEKCRKFNNRIYSTDKTRLPCFTGSSTVVKASTGALVAALLAFLISW